MLNIVRDPTNGKIIAMGGLEFKILDWLSKESNLT